MVNNDNVLMLQDSFVKAQKQYLAFSDESQRKVKHMFIVAQVLKYSYLVAAELPIPEDLAQNIAMYQEYMLVESDNV